MVEFATAADDVTGGNVKTLQSDYLDNGSYPIVDQGQKRVAGYTNDPNRLVRGTAPLIVFGDHTRCLKYLDEPFALGADGVKVLRPKAGFDGRFLYHFLSTLRLPSAGYSRHFKFLKQFSIPAPPIAEQRRIAEVLDRVDALRTKRRQSLAIVEGLTQSLFLDMFGHPADDGRWPRIALSEVARTTSGGTPSRAVGRNYGGAVPWVKSGELHGGVVTTTEESLTEHGLAGSSAKLMPAGVILVAMYGATAGAIARLDIPAATNQAVCSIVVGPSVDGEFLRQALQLLTPKLLSQRVGGAQPNLSQGAIRALTIPLPPLPLQQEFAERLRTLEMISDQQGQHRGCFEKLFASLQQRAFAGEL